MENLLLLARTIEGHRTGGQAGMPVLLRQWEDRLDIHRHVA